MALVKVDSKRRISLPREIYEMLGDTIEIKPVTKKKALLSAAKSKADIKRTNETGIFMKVLEKKPRRTGKPENPSPQEMKSIWAG